MNGKEIQQALFKQVRERLPAHLSLPEELASLLGISADSAYRRVRGEKLMDVEELDRVCQRFSISLDAMLGRSGSSFVFHGNFIGQPYVPFAEWLGGMNEQLTMIADMKDPLFIFRAEDIPTFHHFQIPELTQFKLFFWRRTILNDPAFQSRRFDLEDREEDLLAMARKTYLTYMRLPCTEIWNADSLNAFLRQICFYRDSGILADEKQAGVLFDKLLALIDHLHAETEAGEKFLLGDGPGKGGAAYKVYVNEVMMGDNMIYAGSGDQRMVFLNHSAINYVNTTDPVFCDYTFNSIDNVMRRSVLISGTGEKERNRYFKALRASVDRSRSGGG